MELIQFNNQEVTKTTIKDFCDGVVLAVENGELDPLDAHVRMKHMEEIIKDLKKRLKEYADNQYDRDLEGKKVIRPNAEIQRIDRVATLDYEMDEEYCLRKQALDDRKQLLDDAFKMAEKGSEMVVDGEPVPVVNRKAGGSTYFKINLSK